MIRIDKSKLEDPLYGRAQSYKIAGFEFRAKKGGGYLAFAKDTVIKLALHVGFAEVNFSNAPFKHFKIVKDKNKLDNDLLLMQHKKCCYCESKLGYRDSDVEHFRPKNGRRQNIESKEARPGYYWLAFDKDNLFVSCKDCNGEKGTLFPLKNDDCRSQYALSPIYDHTKEQPLFINPSEDDPEKHIEYREHHPYGLTDKGKKTIDLILKKNETARNKRIEHYDKLKYIADHVKESDDLEGKNILRKAMKKDAEFSAMVRHNFQQLV